MKAGILKRLQAGNGARAPAPVLAPPPPPETPRIPEPEKPAEPSCVEGVELFGDVPWFTDMELRGRLLEEVKKAHAAEKILVAPPAEEILRILAKKGGQMLGAGAVLRLGGVHHGGYGESDINYAYRQLSRALHPDKNPGIEEARPREITETSYGNEAPSPTLLCHRSFPGKKSPKIMESCSPNFCTEAQDAFKRLGEAAEAWCGV